MSHSVGSHRVGFGPIDRREFQVEIDHEGQRLDKALALLCPDLSRSRLQDLIKSGHVQIFGQSCKASYKLERGDIILLEVPHAVAAEPEAENIPIDIVFEDEHLLVINKQAGLVVHPGAGNWSGTLVNALLHHCGDSLSGIGGVMRPGIVHRLDKDTSGLMVVAKHDKAHQGLSEQLSDRSLKRIYKALVHKVPMPIKGVIDQAIDRHAHQRTKMSIVKEGGREAMTHYHVTENYHDALSLVECTLKTGRTHQIRVHMQHLGHPLIGDPLYGVQPTALQASLKKAGYEEAISADILNFPRQALHAQEIEFTHPVTQEVHQYSSDLPEDLCVLINKLNGCL